MNKKIMGRMTLAGLSPEYAQHRLNTLLDGYFRDMAAHESVYRAAIDHAPLEDRPLLHTTLTRIVAAVQLFKAGARPPADWDAELRPQWRIIRVWADLYFADSGERLKETLKHQKRLTIADDKKRIISSAGNKEFEC